MRCRWIRQYNDCTDAGLFSLYPAFQPLVCLMVSTTMIYSNYTQNIRFEFIVCDHHHFNLFRSYTIRLHLLRSHKCARVRASVFSFQYKYTETLLFSICIFQDFFSRFLARIAFQVFYNSMRSFTVNGKLKARLMYNSVWCIFFLPPCDFFSAGCCWWRGSSFYCVTVVAFYFSLQFSIFS